MNATSTISKWGNSKGVRVPAEILKKAQVDLNDMLYFDVDGYGRITMSKVPIPKKRNFGIPVQRLFGQFIQNRIDRYRRASGK